jgi:hypothetical protein
MGDVLMGEAKRRRGRERIGDAPVEQKYIDDMRAVADFIDAIFNDGAKGNARTTGFVLMVFPFEGHEGRCNYMSNASRADVVTMLKEQIKRFEGQPDLTGHA